MNSATFTGIVQFSKPFTEIATLLSLNQLLPLSTSTSPDNANLRGRANEMKDVTGDGKGLSMHGGYAHYVNSEQILHLAKLHAQGS